jgi:hypothetical protein
MRLTTCPVCQYDLAGLPRAHRCPECGFEYDEHTVLLRPDRSRVVDAVFVIQALMILGKTIDLFSGAGDPARWPLRCLIVLMMWCTLWWFRLQLKSRRMGRFVGIHREGITFRGRECKLYSVPWSQLGRDGEIIDDPTSINPFSQARRMQESLTSLKIGSKANSFE